MLIALGSDHRGFQLKIAVIDFLKTEGYKYYDYGCYGTDSVDYPDFAHPVANSVEKGECCFGILLCGSANGVAITANKHQGIRAAICWNAPIAELARKHNNANIICIPARYVSLDLSEQMVESFISTEFEGGRHQTRVSKIASV